jgi:hypothetical protein
MFLIRTLRILRADDACTSSEILTHRSIEKSAFSKKAEVYHDEHLRLAQS